MVGHGGSSTGSYLADPTSLIPSHFASIVVTKTLRVKWLFNMSVRILLSDVRLLVRFYARSTLSLLLIEYRVTYCALGN